MNGNDENNTDSLPPDTFNPEGSLAEASAKAQKVLSIGHYDDLVHRINGIERSVNEIRNALLGSLPKGVGLLAEHRACREQMSGVVRDVPKLTNAVALLETAVAELKVTAHDQGELLQDLDRYRAKLIASYSAITVVILAGWELIRTFWIK